MLCQSSVRSVFNISVCPRPCRLPGGESSFSPPSPPRLWSRTRGLILEIRSLLLLSRPRLLSPIQLYCFRGSSQTLPTLSSLSTLKALRRDQSRSRPRDRLLSKPGPYNTILPMSLFDILGDLTVWEPIISVYLCGLVVKFLVKAGGSCQGFCFRVKYTIVPCKLIRLIIEECIRTSALLSLIHCSLYNVR